MKLLTSLFVLLFGSLAFAGDPNASIDLNQILSLVADNIASGKHVVLGAAIVLGLVALFKRFVQPRIPVGNGALPYLSIALGLLVGLCSDLVNGISAAEAAKIALLSGPGATFFWESLFKLVVKKNEG